MTDIVERVRALLGDTNEEQDTINEAAANEIERLRDALRQISHAPNGKVHCADGHEECVLIARAALEGKE